MTYSVRILGPVNFESICQFTDIQERVNSSAWDLALNLTKTELTLNDYTPLCTEKNTK